MPTSLLPSPLMRLGLKPRKPCTNNFILNVCISVTYSINEIRLKTKESIRALA
jgi:hypothetical protein